MALHRHVSGPGGEAKLGMRPQSEFQLPAEVDEVPRLRLGPVGLPPGIAYQVVHDELLLDGNARLNLATFVTTWMDHQADTLMAECTSKKISKTQSVTSQLRRGMSAEDIHIGPSDHVPWLEDRKWAHIRIEGREFGNVPINVDLKLEVWDSPNSAGVVIDAVRCMRLALDAGVGGALLGPSAYFMKSPPVQYSDDVARQMVEEYIRSVGLPAVDGDLTLQLDEIR